MPTFFFETQETLSVVQKIFSEAGKILSTPGKIIPVMPKIFCTTEMIFLMTRTKVRCRERCSPERNHHLRRGGNFSPVRRDPLDDGKDLSRGKDHGKNNASL